MENISGSFMQYKTFMLNKDSTTHLYITCISWSLSYLWKARIMSLCLQINVVYMPDMNFIYNVM